MSKCSIFHFLAALTAISSLTVAFAAIYVVV